MKSFVATVVTFLTATSAFAGSTADYVLSANASTRGSDGECTQSVLQASQLGDLLYVNTSSNDMGQVMRLSQAQVAQFKRLSARASGREVKVVVKSGGTTYTFLGTSCGSLQCDSLEIKSGRQGPVEYSQPIHGLSKIDCQP